MMLSRSRALDRLQCCIIFFSLLSTNSAGTSCSSPLKLPVEIPIRNITLAGNLMRRGAALSVGSPPQNLAFDFIEGDAQTSLVVDHGPLDQNTPPLRCTAQCGGFFEKNISSSWSQAESFESLHIKAEKPDNGHEGDLFGTDNMSIISTLSLPDYPLGLYSGCYGTMNRLGLGPNSTLLNAMSTAGYIASNTWSFFQGWTGADAEHQIDGSLVLGGYDANKIGDNNITVPFTDDLRCPGGLMVTIADIKMNLKNGSSLTIMGPSAGDSLKACIKLDKPNVVALPRYYWDRFFTISEVQGAVSSERSLGLFFWAMLISADGAYDGNLTITLSPDLEITIPNHQLVLPDYSIDPQGHNIISNATTNRVVLIDSLQATDKYDIPILGRQFFSSAYLLVNNELRTFTISQNNESASKRLVAIGPQSCNDSSPSTKFSSASGSSQTPTTSPSVSPAFPGGISSKRGIAGTVIGTVLFSCLLIGGIFWFRNRTVLSKANTRNVKTVMHHTRETPDTEARNADQLYRKAELPSDRQPPQEMPLVPHSRYSLGLFELPSDRQPPQEMPFVSHSRYSLGRFELSPIESDR